MAEMRIAVIAQSSTPTNEALARVGCRGADWCLLTPAEALATLREGDCAIGRIDVLPTLDGIDEGLWVLGALEARGVTVFNGAPVLLAAHDKLLTARLLRRAGLPHPQTRLISGDRPRSSLRAPVVVKPRFGSWGLGVERCDDEAALARLLAALAGGAVVPGARRSRPGARADARIRPADRRRLRPRDRRDRPGRGPGRMADERRARGRAASGVAVAGRLRARARRRAGGRGRARRCRSAPRRPWRLDGGRAQRGGRVHRGIRSAARSSTRSQRPRLGSAGPRCASVSGESAARRAASGIEFVEPPAPRALVDCAAARLRDCSAA